MASASDPQRRETQPDHPASVHNGSLSTAQPIHSSDASSLLNAAAHSFDAEHADRSMTDDRPDANGPPSPDSAYSAVGPDPSQSTPPPVMGMVGTFADMALGTPMPYPPPMHLMPVQPHPVLPLVPPQHVAQLAPSQHRQPGPPGPSPHPSHPPHVVASQRTSAYHWVPQDRVGAVIGGHGAVIRSLQDKSGAIIQVHNSIVRDDHKLFTILGYPSQIETAIQLTAEIVGRTRSGLANSNNGAGSISGASNGNGGPDRPHFSPFRHPGRSADLSRTIYVPTSCVGLVIGRNGDTIRNLQDNSGAEIKVTPDQHAQPGQADRSILITGSDEAIAIANRLVMEIVRDARSRRYSGPSTPPIGGMVNGEVVIMEELRVPNEKVGLIIGKKGVAIRDLQMRSGAKIQVTKDDSAVQTDGLRPVTITGTRPQVDEACSLIASKISEPYLSSSAVGSSSNPASNVARPDPLSTGTSVPDSAPGEAGAPNLAYGFPNTYDTEIANGQAGFQPVFEGNDPSGHGRGPMTYVQYVGYNNFGAPPHARMNPGLSIPFGGQGQQGLSPTGMTNATGGNGSVAGSDGPDNSIAHPNFAGGSIPDGIPSSPGVPRDPNGNVLMFGTHTPYAMQHMFPANTGMHHPSMFSHETSADHSDVPLQYDNGPQIDNGDKNVVAERRDEKAGRRSQDGASENVSTHQQPKEGSGNG